jgi:ABC-type phosphate transport system substrate-binding protein
MQNIRWEGAYTLLEVGNLDRELQINPTCNVIFANGTAVTFVKQINGSYWFNGMSEPMNESELKQAFAKFIDRYGSAGIIVNPAHPDNLELSLYDKTFKNLK